MKSKTTINLKKFISILLCTIFISSILPSNLLNGTVFAVDDDFSRYKVYEDNDLTFIFHQSGKNFPRIENPSTNENLTNADYSLQPGTDSEGKPTWRVTIKKGYIDKLEKGKDHVLRFWFKPLDKELDDSFSEFTICVKNPEKVEPPCITSPTTISHNIYVSTYAELQDAINNSIGNRIIYLNCDITC